MAQWKYLGEYTSGGVASFLAVDNTLKSQVASFSLALSTSRWGRAFNEVAHITIYFDSAGRPCLKGIKYINRGTTELLDQIYYQAENHGVVFGLRLDAHVFIQLHSKIRIQTGTLLGTPVNFYREIWTKTTDFFRLLQDVRNASLNWDVFLQGDDYLHVGNNKENPFITLDKTANLPKLGVGTDSPGARLTVNGLVSPTITSTSLDYLCGQPGSIGTYNGYILIKAIDSVIPIELKNIQTVSEGWAGQVFYVPGLSLTTNFRVNASSNINPDTATLKLDQYFLYSKVAELDKSAPFVDRTSAGPYNYGFILYKPGGALNGLYPLLGWGGVSLTANDGNVRLDTPGGSIELVSAFDTNWTCTAFSFAAEDSITPNRLALSKYVSGSLDTYSVNGSPVSNGIIDDRIFLGSTSSSPSPYSWLAMFGLFYGKEDVSNDQLEYLSRCVMKAFVEY